MSTFQAAIYGIIHGFSEFLPIGSKAHIALAASILNWAEPTSVFKGALSLGALLALFVYFRHDWASVISGALQCILFRRKPMTLDERLAIFMSIACVPVVIAWLYLSPKIESIEPTPYVVAGVFAVLTLPLIAFDYFNRRTKNIFDWNWLDALLVGITEIASLLPGGGRMPTALAGAFSRNYRRDAAAKFVLFLMFPLLIASAVIHLHGVSLHAAEAAEGISWLTFGVGAIVSFFSSLLAIGALTKQLQRGGVGGYAVYRFTLAAVAASVYWYRSR